MINISVIANFNKIKENIPFEEMLNRIKNGYYSNTIVPLRRKYKEGNIKGADADKRKLEAFTPAGLFKDVRNAEHHTEYSHLMVLDYDKLGYDELNALKEKVSHCQHTLAFFVSPSGRGLKVFVAVTTGPKDHLTAFNEVKRYYEALTGVPIDPSGKDIARLCFVSYDDQLYYNPVATIFNPNSHQEEVKPITEPQPLQNNGNMVIDMRTGEVLNNIPPRPERSVEIDGIAITYKNCVNRVERDMVYIEGSRNEFVFNLALQMRRAGLAEGTTTLLLLGDYNFDEKEVRNCIKSAYSYNWTDKEKPIQQPAAGLKDAPMPGNVDTSKPKGKRKKANPDDPDALPVQKCRSKSKNPYDLAAVESLLKDIYETRYNVVTGVVEWRKAHTNAPFERLLDYHENSMYRMLHYAGEEIPLGMLHAIITSNFSPNFNPFVHYFKKLKKWDGVTDYIGQLIKTVKTQDDEYWDFCFRKWFVAYAASMLNDDVINHTVIVFVGAQGVGKTTWIKMLAPKELKNYLGTAALQTDSKDTAIQLSECIIIIIDELENLNRKDLASFKELITRPEIRIRRPYGRNTENLPHRGSFFASVNHEQILTDTSGSRRYLCSNVIDIDYQHKVDIDGALAQAYALYKSGFKFWFDQSEIRDLTHKNEHYMSKSVEEELIETWLRPVTKEEWNSRNQYMNAHNIQLLTTTEIAAKLMEKVKFNLTDSTIIKIGKILKKQGFERIRKGNSYSYMLRIVEQSVVDKNSKTLENLEAENNETASNEQVIRFEEDLFSANESEESPF
jgi:GTPase SAR1 family protein